MVGPSLRGLYGAKSTVINLDGNETEVTADDAYLAKSIEDPAAETVKGYPPVMPKNVLSGTDLQQVIEYIKTLK